MTGPVRRPSASSIGAAAHAAKVAAGFGHRVLGMISEAREDRFPVVAVTGAPGTGKTVLAQYLRRSRIGRSYSPSALRSEQEERFVQSPWQGRGIRFRVVPGHGEGGQHDRSLARLLHSDHITGLIHVYANGYRTRRTDGVEGRTSATSLAELLEQHRAEELRELDDVLTHLRLAITAHGRPNWIVLALTKADLYAGDLPEVLAANSPGGSGSVARKVDELRARLGSDRLRWECMPVATWLEDYCFDGQTQGSAMTPQDRDVHLDAFRERLAAFTGRG